MRRLLEKLTANRVALAVACICLLVYLPALTCGFVSYDDPDYVLNNSAIRHLDWHFLTTVFTQVHIVWWMPLTWISLAVDYHFWGINPFGYHLTNILLHGCNAALVVLIADRLLQGAAEDCHESLSQTPRSRGGVYFSALLLAGLLWGIHPLRVESVAWVTERKDVLNGLFTLVSVLFYLHFVEKQGRGERAWWHYTGAVVFFSLSLMAKSISVVLPALLLVLDWYPLGRLRRGKLAPLLLEKLPFLALSVVMTGITFYLTAQSRYLVSYEYFPFGQRLVVSGNAVVEYLRLLHFPVGIIPLHLIPEPIPDSYTITTFVTAAIFVAVVVFRKRRWLPAIWLCFLLPLLPVLGFFQNGDQAFAARFTYLPSVAPSIAAAFFIVWLYGRIEAGQRRILLLVPLLAVVYLGFYAVMTERLLTVWKDTATFWSRSIELEPSAILFKERGKYYSSQGNHAAAVADFSAAIELAIGNLRKNIFNLYVLRGEALRSAGRFEEAVNDYSTAISMYPHPSYHYARGLALQGLGREAEAREDLRLAGTETGPLQWYELVEDKGK